MLINFIMCLIRLRAIRWCFSIESIWFICPSEPNWMNYWIDHNKMVKWNMHKCFTLSKFSVLPCQTQCRVYNRSGTQHDILYRTYDWGIGNDFHSLSIFLPWSGFESYSTSHLVTQARTLSLNVPFWTTSKSCQGMYSLKKLIKRLDLSL